MLKFWKKKKGEETPAADAADALAIGLTHLRMQEAAALGIGGAVQI